MYLPGLASTAASFVNSPATIDNLLLLGAGLLSTVSSLEAMIKIVEKI
jgi:hypothetical protein